MSTTKRDKARWRLSDLDRQCCEAIARCEAVPGKAEVTAAVTLARRVYRAAIVVERLDSDQRIAQGIHRMHQILWRMDEAIEKRKRNRLKAASVVRSRDVKEEGVAITVRGSIGSDAHPQWQSDRADD